MSISLDYSDTFSYASYFFEESITCYQNDVIDTETDKNAEYQIEFIVCEAAVSNFLLSTKVESRSVPHEAGANKNWWLLQSHLTREYILIVH